MKQGPLLGINIQIAGNFKLPLYDGGFRSSRQASGGETTATKAANNDSNVNMAT